MFIPPAAIHRNMLVQQYRKSEGWVGVRCRNNPRGLCTHFLWEDPAASGLRSAGRQLNRRRCFFASLNLLTFFGSQARRMGEKEMSERSSTSTAPRR